MLLCLRGVSALWLLGQLVAVRHAPAASDSAAYSAVALSWPLSHVADTCQPADHLGTSSGSSASTSGGFWPSSSPSGTLGSSLPDASPQTPQPVLAPSLSWSKRFANKVLGCSGMSGALLASDWLGMHASQQAAQSLALTL